MSAEYRDEREFDVIFIHSALDDADLSVYAFRLYARIARRAGPQGECYESQPNMAESCNMSRKRLKKALDELCNRGMVRVDRRPGETNIITLTKRSAWTTPGENTQGENDRGPRADSPAVPRADSPDKGNTLKGNPPKGARAETDDDVDDHPAVELHQSFWPGLANRYQREQIASEVDDIDRWRDVLEYWKGNGHRGKSVQRQLQKYNEPSYSGDGHRSNRSPELARPNASAYTNEF